MFIRGELPLKFAARHAGQLGKAAADDFEARHLTIFQRIVLDRLSVDNQWRLPLQNSLSVPHCQEPKGSLTDAVNPICL